MDASIDDAGLLGLIADAQKYILSPREVNERLVGIADKTFAKSLEIRISQHGETYSWGEVENHESRFLLQKGAISEEVSFTIHSDVSPETAEEQSLVPKLTELANHLWGNDVRSMGGLAWKREWTRIRLSMSVERLRAEISANGPVSVLFADLDHFKELNDQASHEEGDRAIRMVNRALHDLCRTHGGLSFHPSGDEFYLILPDVGLLPMLSALYELRLRIKAQPFLAEDGSEHFVDLTLGLKLLEGDVNVSRLEEALQEAEASTKSGAASDPSQKREARLRSGAKTRGTQSDLNAMKTKRRGMLSIATSRPQNADNCSPLELALLGSILIRRRSLKGSAFADPRLGLLELVAKTCHTDATATLDDQIKLVCSWLDIEMASACSYASVLSAQPPKEISRVAIALAVASGVAQAQQDKRGHTLSLKCSKDGAHVQLLQNRKRVWGVSLPTKDNPVKVDLVPSSSKATKRTLIGVQIGLSERLRLADGVDFPRDVLTNVVVVDDRPSSGGGLPDFWQAAVAQVLQCAALHQGEPHVFFWGQQSANSQTLERLRTASWEIDEVASLAGISSMDATKLGRAIKKNTVVVTGAKALCEALYRIAPVCNIDTQSGSCVSQHETEPLRRSMLVSQKLGDIDGIRCRTAASAYPIVVDVMRKSEARFSKDEAGQTLRELLAFKLVLETPLADSIPAYLYEQKADMERYANAVLVEPTGMIRSTLEKRPQIAAFKREIQSCFRRDREATSTRRACLVVPHEPKPNARPTPLGLVSAWASPRIGPNHGHTVDWVFVWRTVEAFIGLPYSLFGSINLAQSLLADIKLEGDGASPKLKMGELTYIALSLHMRVDGVHQRIAKRIVDLSSD